MELAANASDECRLMLLKSVVGSIQNDSSIKARPSGSAPQRRNANRRGCSRGVAMAPLFTNQVPNRNMPNTVGPMNNRLLSMKPTSLARCATACR